MFLKYDIDFKPTFQELEASAQMEDIGNINGRRGAILVSCNDHAVPVVPAVPVVRTTTSYNNPSQYFSSIHYKLIASIQRNKSVPVPMLFNNAMIEVYDFNYRKMKYHSDQALDLEQDSWICIYSCYNNEKCSRSLAIKNKSLGECSKIELTHGSIILFSTSTNKDYLHKIILNQKKGQEENKWLGITFRLSKTFIQFKNSLPYFISNDKLMTLANSKEEQEFIKTKSRENHVNSDMSPIWPEINYTFSPGDLLPPAYK